MEDQGLQTGFSRMLLIDFVWFSLYSLLNSPFHFFFLNRLKKCKQMLIKEEKYADIESYNSSHMIL